MRRVQITTEEVDFNTGSLRNYTEGLLRTNEQKVKLLAQIYFKAYNKEARLELTLLALKQMRWFR